MRDEVVIKNAVENAKQFPGFAQKLDEQNGGGQK